MGLIGGFMNFNSISETNRAAISLNNHNKSNTFVKAVETKKAVCFTNANNESIWIPKKALTFKGRVQATHCDILTFKLATWMEHLLSAEQKSILTS
jgi:hypothetical protein